MRSPSWWLLAKVLDKPAVPPSKKHLCRGRHPMILTKMTNQIMAVIGEIVPMKLALASRSLWFRHLVTDSHTRSILICQSQMTRVPITVTKSWWLLEKKLLKLTVPCVKKDWLTRAFDSRGCSSRTQRSITSALSSYSIRGVTSAVWQVAIYRKRRPS